MNRREFFATSFAGILTAPLAKADKPALDARFDYDISTYLHTDPALLLYNETGKFPTGLHEPKCLTVAGDTILVGGDKALKTFDATGKLLRTRALPALPHAVTTGGLVAYKDRFDGSASFGERAHLTGIAQTGGDIFIADAGNREVLRCDATGKIVSHITGFAVPSPYFDLHVGNDGLLWVANTGTHRVEAYNADGSLELSWGETGMNIEGFCGCCNPVYFTRLTDGRFVTSEKGLNRIKIYSATGKFIGVVAGPEQLVKDLELAKRACANCQIGFGFPVACDAGGRVFTLDPATRDIRIFTPKLA
ncbi:MAG: hypothetical protein WCH84_10940 [Verrucomicrobiota bacterium]